MPSVKVTCCVAVLSVLSIAACTKEASAPVEVIEVPLFARGGNGDINMGTHLSGHEEVLTVAEGAPHPSDSPAQGQAIFRVNADGTTTPVRVYNLPEDIIDNTIKAFSVNVSGYTAGTPTGRYFAPANGPDCIQVLRGDCAPKDIIVVAPVFSRFDFGARKRIPLTQKMNLLVEIDVLNLFNAINFNPVALPVNPTNRDAYRVTTSYQDINQASDPGSRAGQLVFRFNW